MARVARAAEVADDVVRMEVYGHSGHEQRPADIDIGLCEPSGVVVSGRDVENPASLHQGVERVEDHAHQDDAEGHAALAADQQREDEGPLEVVGLEQAEQRQRPGLPHPFGRGPQHAHEDENRRFHHHPAHAVGHGRSVAAVEEIAVTRLEEVQRGVDHGGQKGHDDQENVEILFHRRWG